MSGVFPNGVSSFLESGGSTRKVLYYSTLVEWTPERSQKMFESPVSTTGLRTWKYKGEYATFKIKMLLHKFDSDPLTAPYNTAKSVANLLLDYENTDVSFYPFGELSGSPITAVSTSNHVPCRMLLDFDFEIKEGALLDVCYLTFITNQFYDKGKLII